MGYLGFVIVEINDENVEEKIFEIFEVECVIFVFVEMNVELKEIEKVVDEIVSFISKDEIFVVKIKRCGKYDFLSIDVNCVLGVRIKEIIDVDVNLSWFDKVV